MENLVLNRQVFSFYKASAAEWLIEEVQENYDRFLTENEIDAESLSFDAYADENYYMCEQLKSYANGGYFLKTEIQSLSKHLISLEDKMSIDDFIDCMGGDFDSVVELVKSHELESFLNVLPFQDERESWKFEATKFFNKFK